MTLCENRRANIRAALIYEGICGSFKTFWLVAQYIGCGAYGITKHFIFNIICSTCSYIKVHESKQFQILFC